MSNTVDNRAVELGFDNQQFESGVKTSINSLGELKKGLMLDESAKSLANLGEVGKNFSLQNISDGVGNISSKFSVLGVIGLTAIQNITNAVIDMGRRFWEVLTPMNSIKQGLAEYETQMNAIQTILANTSGAGTTLDEVNQALAELNEYADKTIYNFSEMTRNIGTFTAAGVKLDVAVQAIKGIANLAAVSGSNAQQASTAMYQLSQAISSGTVKLQDWNSVVNAGMGGKVFQDALMETARVHGIAIDDMIKNEGSFRNTLQNGWLTASILTETLAKFTGDLNADQLKTMGYTDAQIAEILKLGQVANDAATKVKTFSQLKDTLMEAIQSGWARSWQIVIGDFEEAKAFFTEVSDTLGELIGASADARNKILEDWKKFGGRTILIDALRNAFQALIGILKVVGDAFREVFPREMLEGQKLKLLTVALRDFTAKLKMGGETANKVKNIFKGIFAIFDIAKMLVVSLATAFLSLFSSVAPSAGSILDFASNLGESIVKIRDYIKENDTFGKAFKKVGEYILLARDKIVEFVRVVKEKFEIAKKYFEDVRKKVVDFVDTIKEKFGFIEKFFSKIWNSADVGKSGIGDFFSKVKERWEPVIKLFGSLGTLFKGVVAVFRSLGEVAIKILGGIGIIIMKLLPYFSKLAEGIGEFMSKIAEKIAEGVKTLDFNKVFDIINSGLIAAILLAIRNFINKGSKSLDGVSGMFDSFKGILDTIGKGISGIFDGVRGSLEAWQQSLKADILLKIAIAIGILTLSLIALSMIDSEKLTASLLAITAMFADLMGSLAIYEKVSGGKGGGGFGLSATLIALSVSLLIMAAALAVLAKIDEKDIQKGIISITALTTILFVFTKEMSQNTKGFLKGAATLIIIAVALELMVNVVKKLGSLDLANLLNGLMGVGILLAELAIFMNLVDKKSVSSGLAILAVSAAILILSSSVEKLGTLDPAKLTQGLTALGAILGELAIFTQLTGDGKNIIATSVGVVIIAAAMLILTSVIEKLGNLSPDQITKGLIAMGAALIMIAAAVNMFPKSAILTGVTLLVIAGAMILLSQALTTLGNMSWEELAKGLLAMAGAMAIIAIAMYAMTGALPGAAALLVVSAALAVLTPILLTLGAMSLQEIGLALLALAGVFLILGLAGLALTPVVPTLLGLGAAIALIGVGVALVGVGLMAMSVALTALAVSGAAAGLGLVAFVSVVLGLVPVVVKAVVDGILLLVTLIAQSTPVFCDAFTTILLSLIAVVVKVTPVFLDALKVLLLKLIDVIKEVVPEFIEAVLMIIDALLKSLAEHVPSFVQSGIDIIMGILKGIRDNIYQMVTVTLEILTNFLNGIASGLPSVIDAGVKVIIAFIKGLADAVNDEKNKKDIKAAAEELATAVVTALSDGIMSGVDGVVAAIKAISDAAIAALKFILGIFSPSKVFFEFGRNTVQGFINGISGMTDKTGRTVAMLGDEAVSKMSGAINGVSDILSREIDMNPTIRPVMDLEDIISGGKKIDSIFSNKSIGLTGSMTNLANMAAGSFGSNQFDKVNYPDGKSPVTYIQNNYSPKALSRLEIYRDTKNQLRIEKGLVGNA